MPKILFIQPTQYSSDKKLCTQKKIHLPGLVFPLLASMTPDHWDVEVKLEVVDKIDFDSDADIIGIGSMGYAIYRGIEIAGEFRKRGKCVVMGGYMASLVADKVLSYVDAVVIGDAEKSYPQLLKDFQNKNVQPIYNMPIDNLKNLPVPRYELLMEKRIGKMLPVQAGRGCPHTCQFCCIASLYQGRYLPRPIDDVVRDINAVRDLGFKQFYLLDDNIISNPSYLKALCKEIEPLKMTWASQCSLHLAKNSDLLEAVRRAGANMMSFGVESITQEGLDKLGKSWLQVNEHKKLISTLTKSGIMVSAEMMIGTDSDTEESIRATLEFIQQVKIPIPRFYILTPAPGSSLYKQLKKDGRLVTEDLQKYDGSQCVHQPAKISPDKLTEMFWWLYRKVFSWKSIIRRTILHPAFWRSPLSYTFAFFVNSHYRSYVMKKVPPNIF
ncbi:MAG: radical SAM protein [Calditrichaeota bacterium]|nr:MAG: radical SAM protein [Calditrichota bacterium]